jgi:hypothetical protein
MGNFGKFLLNVRWPASYRLPGNILHWVQGDNNIE